MKQAQYRQFPNTAKTLLVAVICMGSIFISSNAFSQTEEEVFSEYFKNWYQVELIIFERIEPSSEDPEIWPKNLSLTYPPQLTFLNDPAQEVLSDEHTEEDNENATTSEEEKLDENSHQDLLETLKRSDLNDPLNKKYLDAVEKSELERMTPKEQPFTILEETLSQLGHEAKLLGRDRNMRLLAHKTWRQPMKDQDEALSIVLTGGEEFGEHFELEGSIKLFVSRYLHLHANLWLTQFEANIGQEIEHWPALPERPQPIVYEALTQETKTSDDALGAENFHYNTELNIDEENTVVDEADFGLVYQSSLNNSDLGQLSGPSLLDNLHHAKIEQTPYVIRHIVSMKQKRRMRSGEIHYLDHPKIGVIINIEKYEPEFPGSVDVSMRYQ